MLRYIPMKEQRLLVREWTVVAVIGGFVLTVLAVSWLSQAPVKRRFFTQQANYQGSLIEVHVEGAVKNPGVYYLSAGTSVKEALCQAGLQSRADRKRINFKRKILSPAHIEVPAKNKNTKTEKQKIKREKENLSRGNA